jgi:hypothetical protein
MLAGGGERDSDVGRAEKINEGLRGLVINVEVGDGVAVGREEGEDACTCRAAGGGGARVHGMAVDVAFVNGHEDALVTKAGRDGVAASEVSRCPVRAMGSGT